MNRDYENLAESDEVLFPNTDIIDTEPLYKNFTTIQSFFMQDKQLNSSIQIDSSSNKTHRIDGYIFNLIQIIEDIGYDPKSKFLNSFSTNENNELYNLILILGGTNGPLAKIRCLNIDNEYFQRWYLDNYLCSASMICYKTTQKLDIYQPSNITFKKMDEKNFQKNVLCMYGFEDTETNSSISSRRSSIDEKISNSSGQSTPVVLKTIDNFKPKQQITIREYYPSKDLSSLMVNQSISSSLSSLQQTIDDYDYEQFIQNHPDLYQDPNPEIITKPNPDQVTYKQNVSVRYLVPPTPPPPGPLIIREILPPRPPTPPPLIVKHQEPTPRTPSPLILREAPPPLPPHQEAEVITKVLPQEPPPSQRVIIEHNPPLPPKPQSIIIEKWLPYKPPPPREIIYERIIETPLISEFQPGNQTIDHQYQYSTDLSSRLPIPVHIEQGNSFENLNTQQSTLFDQFARSTQEHLERLQTHQQWITNQHMNMFQQISSQLTTPALIINHPPITRTASSSYVRRDEVFYQPTIINPTYM